MFNVNNRTAHYGSGETATAHIISSILLEHQKPNNIHYIYVPIAYRELRVNDDTDRDHHDPLDQEKSTEKEKTLLILV